MDITSAPTRTTRTTGHHGPRRFDQLMSVEEQAEWLRSTSAASIDPDQRHDLPEQRSRLLPRYEQLVADARFTGVPELLYRYVSTTIPLPEQTERTFWVLSALPGTNSSTWPRLLTLSVQVLETLFISAPKQHPERMTVRMNVDRFTVLAAGSAPERLMSRFPGLTVDGRPGYSRDVLALEWALSPTMPSVPDLPEVIIAAARRLNLDLMRAGGSPHRGSHCFALADLAFTGSWLAGRVGAGP